MWEFPAVFDIQCFSSSSEFLEVWLLLKSSIRCWALGTNANVSCWSRREGFFVGSALLRPPARFGAVNIELWLLIKVRFSRFRDSSCVPKLAGFWLTRFGIRRMLLSSGRIRIPEWGSTTQKTWKPELQNEHTCHKVDFLWRLTEPLPINYVHTIIAVDPPIQSQKQPPQHHYKSLH